MVEAAPCQPKLRLLLQTEHQVVLGYIDCPSTISASYGFDPRLPLHTGE